MKGGYSDMHEGTLDGSRVCIKRVRVYQDDPGKATEVCYLRCRSPCSLSLMKLVGLLSRGRNVEAPGSLKHRTPTVYYHHFPSTHFGLDAWRGPAGLHQEAPQCGPT